MRVMAHPNTPNTWYVTDEETWWAIPREQNGWEKRNVVVPGESAPTLSGLYQPVIRNHYPEMVAKLHNELGMPHASMRHFRISFNYATFSESVEGRSHLLRPLCR